MGLYSPGQIDVFIENHLEIIANCVSKELDESLTATCRNKLNEFEFEVITAVTIQSHVVWDITPYLLVNIYRLLRGHFSYCLQSVR
jgi:hypothetical protein